MPLRKRIKRWLVYVAARLLVVLWSLLPMSLALSLGRFVGRVAHLVAYQPRRIARRQMQAVLSLTEPEAASLCRRLFVHLGQVVAEIVLMPRLLARITTYVTLSDEAQAVLRSAVGEGRGVILISAHLGNWELLAQRVVAAGFDSATIARRNPNPYLGQWLDARRAAGGLEVIDRGDGGAARKILGALKRGAILGMLIDQDTRVQSTFVPFFGQPAKTPIAAAQLSLRGDIPVVAGFIRRTATGHEVDLERVDLDGVEGEDKAARVRDATALMTAVIERAVRRTPAQWVWFHERWKTRPDSGTDLQEPHADA